MSTSTSYIYARFAPLEPVYSGHNYRAVEMLDGTLLLATAPDERPSSVILSKAFSEVAQRLTTNAALEQLNASAALASEIPIKEVEAALGKPIGQTVHVELTNKGLRPKYNPDCEIILLDCNSAMIFNQKQ